jgi:hypothetical protein
MLPDQDQPKPITPLDYFAAHAPKDIPIWFDFDEPEYTGPAHPAIPAGIPDDDRKMLESWLNDACFDLEDKYAWFQQEVEAYREAMRAHKERIVTERYFRWPWAYAKSMLLWRDIYDKQQEAS